VNALIWLTFAENDERADFGMNREDSETVECPKGFREWKMKNAECTHKSGKCEENDDDDDSILASHNNEKWNGICAMMFRRGRGSEKNPGLLA